MRTTLGKESGNGLRKEGLLLHSLQGDIVRYGISTFSTLAAATPARTNMTPSAILQIPLHQHISRKEFAV